MEFEEVENIGQRIKEIRKSKSITIQKLSCSLPICQWISEQSRAEPGKPDANNLQRICAWRLVFRSGICSVLPARREP